MFCLEDRELKNTESNAWREVRGKKNLRLIQKSLKITTNTTKNTTPIVKTTTPSPPPQPLNRNKIQNKNWGTRVVTSAQGWGVRGGRNETGGWGWGKAGGQGSTRPATPRLPPRAVAFIPPLNLSAPILILLISYLS